MDSCGWAWSYPLLLLDIPPAASPADTALCLRVQEMRKTSDLTQTCCDGRGSPGRCSGVAGLEG